MTPEELDRLFAQPAPTVDAAVVDRVSRQFRSVKAVKPVSPVRMGAALCMIFAAASLGGAAKLGFFGWHKLDAIQAAMIFSVLAVVTCLAATVAIGAAIPGSRRWLSPGALLAAGVLLLTAVFFGAFDDYRTDRFVPQGVSCLKAGLLWAAPAALFTWLVLRRGYAVNPGTAGVAAGLFAGLAGITVLELHCPNFRTLHVVIWHTSVVPIAAGVLWAVYSFGLKRKAAELMQ